MLGSPSMPATATISTTTTSATPTSPSRPSRLRGLSYLRSYTRDHLHSTTHSSTGTASPPLYRSTSSPVTNTSSPGARDDPRAREVERRGDAVATSPIQSAGQGWLPSVQGRSGLSRESLHPTSTSTESAAPEPSSLVGMTRSRAASALGPTPTTPTSLQRRSSSDGVAPSTSLATSMPEPTSSAVPKGEQLPTIRFIPHVETRSARPSLHFTALSRTLKSPSTIVRVGRYSERDMSSSDANILPVGFKSKVVSRRHCEFWCTNGQWYVKDVKSSSGTFLNHVRLSSPGAESRAFPVNDGDVVQLGIDFKGGEEVIFRCVKIRIECNRGWQKSLNSYNTTAHKRLLQHSSKSANRDSDVGSISSLECSICLITMTPLHALFKAPCGHVWHYKCVHEFVHGPNWPNFLCPNCRLVTDLDADVEPPEEVEFEDLPEEVEELQQQQTHGDSESDEARLPSVDSNASESAEPGGSDGDAAGGATGDELAQLLEQASLQRPHHQQETTTASENTPSPSQPMTIASGGHARAVSTPDPFGARSTTPTSNVQFALAAGMLGAEGPMTPRNDAGPFVFDGSAGREFTGGR